MNATEESAYAQAIEKLPLERAAFLDVVKRSILTEKVARRGFHVSREYSVDPLERLCVSDVMATKVITVPASLSVKDLLEKYFLA